MSGSESLILLLTAINIADRQRIDPELGRGGRRSSGIVAVAACAEAGPVNASNSHSSPFRGSPPCVGQG